MANFTYQTRRIRGTVVNGVPTCRNEGASTFSVPYADRKPTGDYSLKGLKVKGDHSHALPYEASWQETNPFEGEVNVNARIYYPLETVRCERAGLYTTGTIPLDCGYPNLTNPKIPSTNAALREFLRKSATTAALADAQRAFVNVGMILAERAETAQLIARKCKQLTSLATKQQRASLRKYFASAKNDRRRVARDLAGEHLAFLFGILPLVQEVEGLMEFLDERDPIKVTGRGRRADVTSQPFSRVRTYDQGPNASIRILYDREETTRHSVRVSLQYRVTLLAALRAQELGLNPIALFYDLVPLSFLADFVSNTGNFLRSFGLPGLEYYTGSWTYYRETTYHYVATVPNNAASTNNTIPERTSSGGGNASVKAGAMTRSVYEHEPNAEWVFQNNLSVSKAFTLASLAIQRYVKPLRRIIRQKPFRYRGPRPKYLPPINYR